MAKASLGKLKLEQKIMMYGRPHVITRIFRAKDGSGIITVKDVRDGNSFEFAMEKATKVTLA